MQNLASKILCIFVTGGAYTPYAPCLSTPLFVSFIWLRIRLKLLLTRVNTILTFMVRTVLLVNNNFNSLKLKLGYNPQEGYNRVKSILTFT